MKYKHEVFNVGDYKVITKDNIISCYDKNNLGLGSYIFAVLETKNNKQINRLIINTQEKSYLCNKKTNKKIKEYNQGFLIVAYDNDLFVSGGKMLKGDVSTIK